MNVYTRQHPYYCGIDLHARTMFICVLDIDGKIVFHNNWPCNPESFLEAIAPFR